MLIDLDALPPDPGTAANRALRETEAEIAALTGNARSTYRLKKDFERDMAELEALAGRRMRLEDF